MKTVKVVSSLSQVQLSFRIFGICRYHSARQRYLRYNASKRGNELRFVTY